MVKPFKNYYGGNIKMKKIISIVLAAAMMLCMMFALASCGSEKIIVQTNAFFAPFEYFEGTEVKGVDVDVMNFVGEKLGKEVEFVNTEFSGIIDSVAEGKVCDAGAAGITITAARQEKVDFSKPYYTSIQYVIFAADDESIVTKTNANGDEYVVWEAIAGKIIGTQLDTTGWIYVDGEIAEGGVLYETNSTHKPFDNAQLAADGIGSKLVDVVVIDQLPAEYITSKNTKLKAVPLYYAGETDAEDAPVQEEYAICVTKGNTELLNAINEVLDTLLVADENGQTGIQKLVMKHMGLDK